MNQNKSKPFQIHPQPVTRRDFLSRGLIGISAYAVMPSILTLLLTERSVRADECPVSTGPGALPAFLVFDLAGGASLSGNWVVLGQDGNMLSSYSDLGLGTAPTVDSQFGAPMASGFTTTSSSGVTTSQILKGILDNTTPEARASLRMATMAHPSLSDTGSNQHSALMHIAQAGYQGIYVRSPVGTTTRRSGGNTDIALFNPSMQPLKVGSSDDFANALNYGPALTRLPQSQLQALSKAILKLSQAQAKKLTEMSFGQQISSLIHCGFLKNQDFTGVTTGIDPRQDAIFQRIYSIATNTNTSDSKVQAATIVMNVLKGNSGPGVISMGGYDYHDGTQTTGDVMDLAAGVQIGRAVQAAFEMGKPLVFQILTDGGIYSDSGTRLWRGDANDKSLTVVGVLKPGAPARIKRSQVGYYTSRQVAASNTLIGGDPRMVAHSVFANYLSVAGKLDQFNQTVSRDFFSPSQASEVLLFD